MEQLIKELLSTLMGAEYLQLERIYRQNAHRNKSSRETRPIHVRSLRYQDRDPIPKGVSSKLKG